MKKILLKNIHPDITQIISMFWLIEILVVGMLEFEAYKEQIATYLETYCGIKAIVALCVYTAIASWPMLRMYPTKPKNK